MAIKGSFYKSKGPDIAGAFREGQETAREALATEEEELQQDDDKESTKKEAVDEKSKDQTQTPDNGGGGGLGRLFGGGQGKGLFAKKEGGTRMGNLLRSIGSVVTKSKG